MAIAAGMVLLETHYRERKGTYILDKAPNIV